MTTGMQRRPGSFWWAAAAVLAVAIAVDVIDGSALKLLSSVLLLAGCALHAALAVAGCFAAAAAVLAYRLATSTL